MKRKSKKVERGWAKAASFLIVTIKRKRFFIKG
jgi:hypothetical protein